MVIISIRHELGQDRPVSASSNSLIYHCIRRGLLCQRVIHFAVAVSVVIRADFYVSFLCICAGFVIGTCALSQHIIKHLPNLL